MIPSPSSESGAVRNDVVIRAANLGKVYRLYAKPAYRFRDMFGLLGHKPGAYFVDAQGRIVRRVGTGSRWLHDAVQIRGELFGLAPFDQNEVVLLNIETRNVVCRIGCDDRGRPERLSFGPSPACGEPLDGRQSGVRQSVHLLGPLTDGREMVLAALGRQQAAMVLARDAMNAAHAKEIEARDTTIAAHAKAIGARDATLASLQEEYVQAVTARDGVIAALAEARASAVVGLQEEINRRDRMVAEMNATLIELQHAVARAQEEINGRDRTLVELNGTLIEMQHHGARAGGDQPPRSNARRGESVPDRVAARRGAPAGGDQSARRHHR